MTPLEGNRQAGASGDFVCAQPRQSDGTRQAAPAAAGGKRDHQDGPVANVAQAVAATGRQQFGQHVTGDRLGAPAAALPWHGADGQPDR